MTSNTTSTLARGCGTRGGPLNLPRVCLFGSDLLSVRIDLDQEDNP